ncbi:hypothetical protein [Kribbella jiaozuonensis]|uniref:DoxX family membrane protein n=1 Tax=Kribbella jiaozuonensis TaxID=2575441 RepID=A0A4U3LKG3_9ACTN|nr:hypothetical protein [Kribbella jiaozuonensis]TKK76080.1 hypothetical protein FDA38_27030 [Kribbella jiaozuonensis]
MDLQLKAWEVPLRVAAGAFILNSGLVKLRADEAAANQTHGFATGAYPALRRLDPRWFVAALSAGEIALGTALLVPVVPPAIVGAGLTAFSGTLLGLYLRTPGLRQQGSLRPTDQGIPIAKDVWLLAIGLAFLVDDVRDRMRGKT